MSRGEGCGNRGRVLTFWDAEKGGDIKNGPLKGGGSCKYMAVIISRFTHRRKRKFFIWLKNVGEIGESSDQLSESESDS